MKFLGLLVLLAVFSANAETVVCTDGDYFLTLKAERRGTTAAYGICEFSECADGASQALNMTEGHDLIFNYQIPDPQSDRALRVIFNFDGGIERAEQLCDGVVFQSFDRCLHSAL